MKLLNSISVGNVLGEGVLWRASDSTVWWTDIQSECLWRMDWPSEELTRFETPGRVGSLALVEGTDEWLLIACENRFGLFAPETGATKWVEAGRLDWGAGLRLNDGRTDPDGRFWVGSMYEGDASFPEGKRPAALYRMSCEGNAEPILGDLQISNGLCWSPDGDAVFLSDSPLGTVWRAPFSREVGAPGRFERFAQFSGESPDGAVTDNAGNYWVALWGGGRVACINPEGREVVSVPVPASQPTCVAFGGSDLDLLFITSARDGLTEEQLEREPGAGNIFVVETGFEGQPAQRVNTTQFLLGSSVA